MRMLKASEVTPRNVKNVLPDICKGRTYIEAAEGMNFKITGAAINYYPARTEDGEDMTTKDGKTILKRVAYVLIDGGFYSSFKGYTAVEQIISCAAMHLESEVPGTVEVEDFGEPIEVSVIKVKEKMGKGSYDYMAIEPKE